MTPERIEKLRSTLDKRQPDLTVITDYVHKGRNLSAIVRTADAVGIGDVHCVIGDKDYRSFRGTALGSHRWVKVHRYTDIKEPVKKLKQQGFQIVAAHLSDSAVDFHEIDYTKPTALVMGAEKEGLSAEAGDLADAHITIPMVGMVESFNVSVAAGIILSEALHQRQAKNMYSQRRIDQETYQRLFFQWGHPQVSDYCQKNDLEYPMLRDDGEIDNPSAWYEKVRALKNGSAFS
jgi:tRNA (guanosine-2'-O-)-methyltransferase